jgi:histidyl-tRNA synthetase
MRVQRCKGSRDLSPGEMTRFRLIEGVFRDCCLKWGYEEVRTPTLEYLHLFTSTGTLTPGMLGRVYSFLDWDGWSGERVVLRPDGTIPIARLYIDSMAEKAPAKLFYVANVFTFEETGEKTRERWQCGTELIGAGSVTADVELITLALDVLKRLKLENVEVKLSHAGLIRALLTKLGLSPDEQTRIFDRLLDGDTEALTGLKPSEPALGRALAPLLDMKGKSPGFLKNLKTVFAGDLPELKPPLNNFIDIVNNLEALGYDYQIDITSGRGFEYYTGLIFQLFIGGKKIGGGGRYDDLIPLMGGSDIPASGFALYLDRLMEMVKPEALAGPSAQRVLVRAKEETMKEGFNIAHRLREAGHVAELQLGKQEPANIQWTLDVQSKAPLFMLTERANNKKLALQTAEEVIRLLGEEGADKNSPA